MTRIVGVDGHARGWIAVELDRRGHYRRAWPARTLTELLADVPLDATVGVDIPLGLVESGWRTADRAAAARLGPRRASLFVVPPRPVWSATSHAEANQACVRLTGGGFSVQAWGLRTKILEADAYRDSGRHELAEVHPELVFATLGGAPAAYPKKTWNGQRLRAGLLAAVGIGLPDDLGPAGAVPPDDVLDAAAVAWCAYEMSHHRSRHVPDPPDQYDHRGRPIVIGF